MRVILEQGDKPEMRSLIFSLQNCGLDFVIIEKQTKLVHKLLSDDEIKKAILNVMPLFSVRSQWVAIYRVLVDYYGFPEDVSAFYRRVSKMMKGTNICYAVNYQSIQKTLAANSILQKPFSQWEMYQIPMGDRLFARQMLVAKSLLGLLEAI